MKFVETVNREFNDRLWVFRVVSCPFSDDDDEREPFEWKMRIEESFAFVRKFASLMGFRISRRFEIPLKGLDAYCLLETHSLNYEMNSDGILIIFAIKANHKSPQRVDPGEKFFPFSSPIPRLGT